MTLEHMTVVLGLLQIAVLLFCIISAARLLRSGRRVMVVVLFLFAMVSVAASSLYWLVYDMMRPGTRMPFAVNEIGEWASYLLFGAALNEVFCGRFGDARREIVCAAVFVAASAALWIAWSGEWLQDILCGAAFAYLLCSAVRSCKLSGAFSRVGWILLACLAAALILGQTATFFAPAGWRPPLDYLCYALMLGGHVLFVVQNLRARRRRDEPAVLLSLSFGGFCWCLSSLYMSDGWFYMTWLILSMLFSLLMLMAVREEAAA